MRFTRSGLWYVLAVLFVAWLAHDAWVASRSTETMRTGS